jgi:lipopolysaccharide transport system permease protein
MLASRRPPFFAALWSRRELIWRLAERDVLGRYRGSVIGWAWTFLHPLAMLAVYTFVFSQVFKAKWGASTENLGPLAFAINLFAGLIVFNQLSECVGKAPSLVLASPNFVKKIVFPLEILSAVSVASAFVHTLTSLVILALFELLSRGSLPWSYFWLPLVWLPLLLTCLSISWLLSAIGVYLRDVGQVAGVAMSMLLFISPIFFPLAALPARWQPFLGLNPVAVIIEQTRRVAVLGASPSWGYVLFGTLIAAAAAEASYRFFLRVKPGFADVI